MSEPLKRDMMVMLDEKQRTIESRMKNKMEMLFKDAGRYVAIPGLVASCVSSAIEKKDCEFTTFT